MKLSIAAATVFLGLVSVAQADEYGDVLRAMDACAGMTDGAQRLACYDKVSPQVKATLARMPRTAPPTADEQKSWFGFDFADLFGSTPNQQTTPDKFGGENLPAPPPKPGEAPPPEPIDSITAKVTDYAFTPFGKFIVFLDSGQVWRQVEGDTDKASFTKDATVTISRGFIGSYTLQIGDSAKTFKVKRVK
ncbi:MAG TPA: hypothetical protein VG889_03475 [Rhizomicrobium sp.]|nr:hypothetical protein [Rhizomicrobium sp.]